MWTKIYRRPTYRVNFHLFIGVWCLSKQYLHKPFQAHGLTPSIHGNALLKFLYALINIYVPTRGIKILCNFLLGSLNVLCCSSFLDLWNSPKPSIISVDFYSFLITHHLLCTFVRGVHGNLLLPLVRVVVLFLSYLSMSQPPETYVFCQDYAKEQEERHRRKIILPNDIPWEFRGSRDSQVGFWKNYSLNKFLLCPESILKF